MAHVFINFRLNLNLCVTVCRWDSLCAYLCVLHVWPCVCHRTVGFTMRLILGEQCFMFGFNENEQLQAQRLSSLFTTLQLNLISSQDLSLITLRLRGKNALRLSHELGWSESLKQANLQSWQIGLRLILFALYAQIFFSSVHLKITLEVRCVRNCTNRLRAFKKVRKHGEKTCSPF